MIAKSLSQTPLGRAVLHLKCLCHHPSAAGFHFKGLKRNLLECAGPKKKPKVKAAKKRSRKKSA